MELTCIVFVYRSLDPTFGLEMRNHVAYVRSARLKDCGDLRRRRRLAVFEEEGGEDESLQKVHAFVFKTSVDIGNDRFVNGVESDERTFAKITINFHAPASPISFIIQLLLTKISFFLLRDYEKVCTPIS